MDSKDSQSLDILGIKPIGESISTLTKGAVDGAAAFLGRICLPAAEEVGLLLRDKVSQWRAQNLVSIAEKTHAKLGDSNVKHAHPRLLFQALENGSWADADDVQEMWAGLIASSCTEDGRDDSNLMFLNVLSQLTTSQVRILNYGCANCQKFVTHGGGWIQGSPVIIKLEKLQEITRVADFHRLDRELDHLRALDLITGGFPPDSTDADIGPTGLALHLYVRGQGSSQSPVEYFGITSAGDGAA
jgi:Abortive infection alpha